MVTWKPHPTGRASLIHASGRITFTFAPLGVHLDCNQPCRPRELVTAVGFGGLRLLSTRIGGCNRLQPWWLEGLRELRGPSPVGQREALEASCRDGWSEERSRAQGGAPGQVKVNLPVPVKVIRPEAWIISTDEQCASQPSEAWFSLSSTGGGQQEMGCAARAGLVA